MLRLSPCFRRCGGGHAPLGLALVLLAAAACSVAPEAVQPVRGRLTARLERPSDHPEGPGSRAFDAAGTARMEGESLVISGRSGDDVIVVRVASFRKREGIFQLAGVESFGAFGTVGGPCPEASPDADPPCKLPFTSRANFGLMTVTTYRPDRIAGTLHFRALDREHPELAFNVVDGAYDLVIEQGTTP